MKKENIKEYWIAILQMIWYTILWIIALLFWILALYIIIKYSYFVPYIKWILWPITTLFILVGCMIFGYKIVNDDFKN